MRMFKSEKIGAFLDAMAHRVVTAKGGAETTFLDLTWRIQPLTPELAGELGDPVKRSLFRLTDAEPVPHLQTAGLKLGIPQQEVFVFTTPETKRSKFHLVRCDISKIVSVRADKDMPGFVASFRTSFSNPDKDQLKYFNDSLYKQHFLTFQATDDALALEDEDGGAERAENEAREVELQRQAEADQAALEAGTGEYAEERRQAVNELDPDDDAATAEPARHLPLRHKDRKKRPTTRAGRAEAARAHKGKRR